MTPLMHAAYKGKADLCRLLLQHGADVNCNQHEYGYTALMFAGLSGKTMCVTQFCCILCKVLLIYYKLIYFIILG